MVSIQILEYDSHNLNAPPLKLHNLTKSQSNSPVVAYKPSFQTYSPKGSTIKPKTRRTEFYSSKQLPYVTANFQGPTVSFPKNLKSGSREFQVSLANEDADPYLFNLFDKFGQLEKKKKEVYKHHDHYTFSGTFPTQQRVDLLSPRTPKEEKSNSRFPKEMLNSKGNLEPVSQSDRNGQSGRRENKKTAHREKVLSSENVEYIKKSDIKKEKPKSNQFFTPKNLSSRTGNGKAFAFPQGKNDALDLAENKYFKQSEPKAQTEAKDLERLLLTEWNNEREEDHGPYRIRQRINFTRTSERRNENKEKNEVEAFSNKQLVENVDIKLREIDAVGARAATTYSFGERNNNQKFFVRVRSRVSSIRDNTLSKENKEGSDNLKIQNFLTPKSATSLGNNNIFNYGEYFKKRYLEKGTSMEVSKDLQHRIKALDDEIQQSVKRLGTGVGKMRSES